MAMSRRPWSRYQGGAASTRVLKSKGGAGGGQPLHELITSEVDGVTAAYTGVFADTFGEEWCDGLVVEWGPNLRAAIYGPYGDAALFEIHCGDAVYSAVTYTSDKEGDMSPGGFVTVLFEFIAGTGGFWRRRLLRRSSQGPRASSSSGSDERGRGRRAWRRGEKP